VNAIRKIATLITFALGLALAAFALGSGTASADSGLNWDAVAKCESGGNWAANTGNGFYGGLQFKPATWTANGGVGSPHTASRAEQIRWRRTSWPSRAWVLWPTCGAGRYPRRSRPDPDLEHHHSGLVHHHRSRPGSPCAGTSAADRSG
jgi:hypothetical protein